MRFGLTGISGILYAAQHISSCGYPEAKELADLLASDLQSLSINHDRPLDIYTGISSDIITMLYFENTYSIDESLIHTHMNYLKEKCPDPEKYLLDKDSVFSNGEPFPPILGYAHGIAGVAIAFLRYAKRFNDASSFAWVRKTLRLLDRYFLPLQQYWPDMRPHIIRRNPVKSVNELVQFPPSWCNGHVGIGLFYLECYIQDFDPQECVLQGIQNAIHNCSKIANQYDYLADLCCGFYADLDFLHYLSQSKIGDKFIEVKGLIDKLYDKVQSHDIQFDSINLFHGIPSYLYIYLRHKNPSTMPCVLHCK